MQVFYANVMLGFIDAQRAEYGLVRPKVHRRKQQTTKVDVQRTTPRGFKVDRPAQRTKQAKRSTSRVTKRDTPSATKGRRR